MIHVKVLKKNDGFKGKRICYLSIISLIVITQFKPLNAVGSSVSIKDICELTTDRYPDQDNNITGILHSYQSCLELIAKYPDTTREELFKQLTDKFECFKEDLKHMYYAGNIKYDDLELVENMEVELKRNGIHLNIDNIRTGNIKCNFARLARSTAKHIIPLVVTGTLSEKQKACDSIFKRDRGGNMTQLDVPTPKLDNKNNPKEITVPTANPSTYKIDSPEAQDVLTQYYKVVMKCLTLTTSHKIQVFRFNKKFYDWLTESVLPHLTEDKCYPAFGGVLRIVETMRDNDFVPKNETANFIFYRQRDLEKNEEELRKKEDNPSKILHFVYFPLILSFWIGLVILVFLFIYFCRAGLCPVWCGGGKDGYDSEGSPEVFYYPIEETPSVSLDLDDMSSDHSYRDKPQELEDSGSVKRQRGGDDSQFYSALYEQQATLMGLPLKRQWTSKDSFLSVLKSPGKRQKKDVYQ